MLRLLACLRLVLVVGFVAVPSKVLAQATIDVQLFSPALHGGGLFSTESGAIVPSLEVRASAWFIYMNQPLNLLTTGTAAGQSAIINHRFDMQLNAAVSLIERLSFGLSIPTMLYQSANLPDASGSQQALAAIAFGDLKLSAKGGILKAAKQFVDLAAIINVTLPTGNRNSFVGNPTVTGSLELDLSRKLGPVLMAGNFGFLLRGTTTVGDLTVGHELFYRVGASFDAAYFAAKIPLEVIGEIFGRTNASRPFTLEQENPLEWLLGLRWGFLERHLLLSLAGGRGLLPGYGAPNARVVFGLTFVPLYPQAASQQAPVVATDSDNDGLLDAADKCPRQAEDIDGFQDADGCPDPDNDGDGLLDASDKCPTEAEDQDGFKDDDGCIDVDNDADGILDDADKCPFQAEDIDAFEDGDGCLDVDNDADGIADVDDKCPGQAEDVDGFQDSDGCPEADNDDDGIPDSKDQCPGEPETVNLVDDFDGCPDKGVSLVTVSRDQINILEKIYFETGKDALREVSYGLLQQVATVIRTRDMIKKIRVEGHTDDVGPADRNMILSQRRADSVMAYLISQGVPAERLEAVGYGESMPVVAGTSPKARDQNRRVTFTIVETGN